MEKNDNFIIQLRKGVFDLAILSLISKQPMYGYEITSALQDIPVFHIPKRFDLSYIKSNHEK